MKGAWPMIPLPAPSGFVLGKKRNMYKQERWAERQRMRKELGLKFNPLSRRWEKA